MTTKTITLLAPPEVGIHGWLYGRAQYLRKEGVSADNVYKVLREVCDKYPMRDKRVVPDAEIRAAVGNAYRTVLGAPPKPAAPVAFDPVAGWPGDISVPRVAIDPQLVVKALAESPVAGLSDIPPTSGKPSDLFRETDMVCVGKSATEFSVGEAHIFAGNPSYQFIVPNPLRKAVGRTKNGGVSNHCRDCVADRRYIIVESDAGLSHDQQVAILFWLEKTTGSPLAAVVHSCGKSIHGWFRCEGVPPDRLFAWFKYAVSVGADPRLFLPEQFVRMPGGTRENGTQQKLLYIHV